MVNILPESPHTPHPQPRVKIVWGKTGKRCASRIYIPLCQLLLPEFSHLGTKPHSTSWRTTWRCNSFTKVHPTTSQRRCLPHGDTCTQHGVRRWRVKERDSILPWLSHSWPGRRLLCVVGLIGSATSLFVPTCWKCGRDSMLVVNRWDDLKVLSCYCPLSGCAIC